MPSVVDEPTLLPQAKHQFEVLADESGYIHEIVADEVGHAASMLGAGRLTKGSRKSTFLLELYCRKK